MTWLPATISKSTRQDSAAGVPKCVVIDSKFDWEDDCRPELPLADSVIYEVHVRGFSIRNPGIPEELRGTYAGLAHEVSIDYFKKLGITAVELLPIHHFIDEGHLVDKGLTDYWGYNTLGFFAPMSRYSSSGDLGGQVVEFKEMVKALHAAGIEVILDVVYNHTCEGNHLGPTLSWRGRLQLDLLPIDGQSALLHGLHRHRQHAQRAQSAGAEDDHGFAALLGDGDARRWLPFRPRRHARA